jgi:hypothetical protein
MRTNRIGAKTIATAAAVCALMGVTGLGVGAGTASAAPPMDHSFSTDKPWWKDGHGRGHWDPWRDNRRNDCISVTGPFGHVTWTSCG